MNNCIQPITNEDYLHYNSCVEQNKYDFDHSYCNNTTYKHCCNYSNKNCENSSKSCHGAFLNCDRDELEKSALNFASLSESNPFYFEVAVEVAIALAAYQRRNEQQQQHQCTTKSCCLTHSTKNNTKLHSNCIGSNRMLFYTVIYFKLINKKTTLNNKNMFNC